MTWSVTAMATAIAMPRGWATASPSGSATASSSGSARRLVWATRSGSVTRSGSATVRRVRRGRRGRSRAGDADGDVVAAMSWHTGVPLRPSAAQVVRPTRPVTVKLQLGLRGLDGALGGRTEAAVDRRTDRGLKHLDRQAGHAELENGATAGHAAAVRLLRARCPRDVAGKLVPGRSVDDAGGREPVSGLPLRDGLRGQRAEVAVRIGMDERLDRADRGAVSPLAERGAGEGRRSRGRRGFDGRERAERERRDKRDRNRVEPRAQHVCPLCLVRDSRECSDRCCFGRQMAPADPPFGLTPDSSTRSRTAGLVTTGHLG